MKGHPGQRCYEQTGLGAQTWLEVAGLWGRLRVEPT